MAIPLMKKSKLALAALSLLLLAAAGSGSEIWSETSAQLESGLAEPHVSEQKLSQVLCGAPGLLAAGLFACLAMTAEAAIKSAVLVAQSYCRDEPVEGEFEAYELAFQLENGLVPVRYKKCDEAQSPG